MNFPRYATLVHFFVLAAGLQAGAQTDELSPQCGNLVVWIKK